jgi:hypothetical protein
LPNSQYSFLIIETETNYLFKSGRDGKQNETFPENNEKQKIPKLQMSDENASILVWGTFPLTTSGADDVADTKKWMRQVHILV